MKKIISVLISILMCIGLLACTPNQPLKTTFTLMFKNGSTVNNIEIDLAKFSGKSLIDVLQSDEYKDEIKAEIDDSSGYGAYVSSIYEMIPN